MAKVYKDDVGTVIQVDVGTNVSAAVTTSLKVRKPDGTTDTWVASVNGSDNTQIDYTTIADDLDQVGEYVVQAYIVMPTWTGHGQSARFSVHDNYE